MSEFMQRELPLFEQHLALRNQLMAVLSDADLAFSPGGDAPTLGQLCRTMGEVEYSYIQSFKHFNQDWSYRHDDGVLTSVERLKAWYAELDADFLATLHHLSDDQFARPIDRGEGFNPTAGTQYHIYREALLIWYGKVSVYLQALRKPYPTQQWLDWIA